MSDDDCSHKSGGLVSLCQNFYGVKRLVVKRLGVLSKKARSMEYGVWQGGPLKPVQFTTPSSSNSPFCFTVQSALDDSTLLELTGTWQAMQRPTNYSGICEAYIAGQLLVDDVEANPSILQQLQQERQHQHHQHQQQPQQHQHSSICQQKAAAGLLTQRSYPKLAVRPLCFLVLQCCFFLCFKTTRRGCL